MSSDISGPSLPRGFPLFLGLPLAVARRPLPVVLVLLALVARVDRYPVDGGSDLVLHEQLVVLRNVEVVLGQPLDAHRGHECTTALWGAKGDRFIYLVDLLNERA